MPDTLTGLFTDMIQNSFHNLSQTQNTVNFDTKDIVILSCSPQAAEDTDIVGFRLEAMGATFWAKTRLDQSEAAKLFHDKKYEFASISVNTVVTATTSRESKAKSDMKRLSWDVLSPENMHFTLRRCQFPFVHGPKTVRA